MSKAKQKAEVLYPILETDKIGNNPYISHNVEQLAKREGYIEDYHQAEKDLELSWKDIELIVNIDKDTDNEESIIGVRKNGEHYKEVLKRFKDFKERKELEKQK